MASPSPCHVKITDCVYQVCIAHAMMTEREEVMGLLLGEVAGQDVHIWASLTLQRSDKRPDRCEISPEQLVEATETAERLSEESGRKTTVVGWYHSHPHITCLPSHVDLRTQMQYQGMDSSFVGLIFAVFNADPRTGSMRHELMAFRSTTTSPPERVELLVVVVQLCAVLSAEEERKALDSGCLGGCMGPSAMVSTARNLFAELMGNHTEELQALRGPGYSLARVDAMMKHSRQLNAMLSNEIVTLEQHFQDAAHNTRVLADMHRERNASARSQPLIWTSPWCTVAPRDPSVSAAATLEVASPARAGVGAGSDAPAETAGGAADATNGFFLEGSAAAWSHTLCMARVVDKTINSEGRLMFRQCNKKRARDSDLCAANHMQKLLPYGRIDHEEGLSLPMAAKITRKPCPPNSVRKFSQADPEPEEDCVMNSELGCIAFDAARNVYTVTPKGEAKQRDYAVGRRDKAEVYEDAQMYLVTMGFATGGSSSSLISAAAVAPARAPAAAPTAAVCGATSMDPGEKKKRPGRGGNVRDRLAQLSVEERSTPLIACPAAAGGALQPTPQLPMETRAVRGGTSAAGPNHEAAPKATRL